jgi:hypothetical protein
VAVASPAPPGLRPYQGAEASTLAGTQVRHRSQSPSRKLPGAMKIRFRSPTPVREVVKYRQDESPAELDTLEKQVAKKTSDAADKALPTKKPWEETRVTQPPKKTAMKKWLPWSLYKKQVDLRNAKGKGKSASKSQSKSKNKSAKGGKQK